MTKLEYNYKQDIKFTLGYAGTGKSTLLAKEANDNTIVLTPTHKAKEVLQAKGLKQVFTIHSVLKLVPTLDMNFRKKGKMQKLQRLGDVDLAEIDTIIIDEFSMIPTHIMDLLLELLPANADVLVYGDPYQLPPVDGEPVDPEYYGRSITTLTKQYRAEAPEVIETFTRFVHFLENPRANADLTLNPAIKKGGLVDFNPDTDRALAFTNKRVIEINTRIAKQLNLPREISIGETVMINGLIGEIVAEPDDLEGMRTIYPKCVTKGRLMSGNKLDATIDSIEADMKKFNQRIIDGDPYYISIEDTIYVFFGDIDHYAHNTTYKQEVENTQLELINEFDLAEDIDLKDWCRHNRNDYTRARGKAWSNYLSHQGLTWDLRRPFATTIHSSQGSEFNTVYLAQDDIKKAIHGNNYDQYARLMYVALSRAIKKVVII